MIDSKKFSKNILDTNHNTQQKHRQSREHKLFVNLAR